jgi:hypothetical protein
VTNVRGAGYYQSSSTYCGYAWSPTSGESNEWVLTRVSLKSGHLSVREIYVDLSGGL